MHHFNGPAQFDRSDLTRSNAAYVWTESCQIKIRLKQYKVERAQECVVIYYSVFQKLSHMFIILKWLTL